MFRLINTEIHDAYTNMALDEACMEAVREGRVPLTVRFYRWQPSAVSIGTFQSMKDEVAVDVCGEKGIDVVRRRTGGGAVYHDSEGEVTYSVIGREDFFPKDIIASYKLICGFLIDGLASLGIAAEFHPINDVLAGGKKISGNAQTRRQGVLLQHGTVLYTVDVRKMFSVLTVGQDKMADKLIAAVEDRVTSIKNLKPEVTREQVEEALKEAFVRGLRTEGGLRLGESAEGFDLDGKWTEEEIERAAELVKERYGREEWNFLK